jgi:hypothetical protein
LAAIVYLFLQVLEYIGLANSHKIFLSAPALQLSVYWYALWQLLLLLLL